MQFIKRKLGLVDTTTQQQQTEPKQGTEEEKRVSQNENENESIVLEGSENNGIIDSTKRVEETSSMGSILMSMMNKATIGSDVWRVGLSLPSWLYEPLTTLQRQAEMIEYADVLSTAANYTDSLDILAFVGSFTVSSYSATKRFKPNFNSLLGETFEYVHKRTNSRIIAEQVSHHPPIAAVHAEDENWTFWQNCSPVTYFLGNSLDLVTNGNTHIYFPKTKDHFFYTNTTTRVHNIIFGSMWIEHFGQVSIRNLRNDHTCVINFKKSGVFQGTQYKVDGYVCDSDGKQCVHLEGEWDSYVDATWLVDTASFKQGQKQRLWQITPDNFLGPPYHFSRYAASLNEYTEEMLAVLPCTDSRKRLDRIYLELGDSNSSTQWKRNLEDRQRQDSKKQTGKWKPVWFKEEKANDGTDEDKKIWVYSGGYWEQREKIRNMIKEGKDYSELLNDSVRGTACDFESYVDPNADNLRKIRLKQTANQHNCSVEHCNNENCNHEKGTQESTENEEHKVHHNEEDNGKVLDQNGYKVIINSEEDD